MTPREREEQRTREAERQKKARDKRYAAAQKAREERMNPPLTLHQLRRKSEEEKQKIKERYQKELEESQKEEAALTRKREDAEDDRLQSHVNKLYVGCVSDREEEGIPRERALEICEKAYSPDEETIDSEKEEREKEEAMAAANCRRDYWYNVLTKTCEKISSAIDSARYGYGDGEHNYVQGALEALQYGINWNKGGGRTRRKRRRSKRKTKRKTIRKRNKRRRKTRKRRKVKRKRRRKSRR